MTGLNSAAIIAAAISDLEASGLFETVQGHETLSSPGNGLTADVWVESIKPVPAASGLDETTALLTLTCRIYLNADSQPADGIETAVTGAVDTLMTTYTGQFTFGGLVMEIDLLGAYGTDLAAQAGYVTVGGTVYRCMTITVPCVIDNAWPQAQ